MRRPACSWLDVKLGLRIMRRYPGVSLIIVFALAVGIPVSLLPNHLVTATLEASPPFDDGKRVVGVVGVGEEGRTELRVGDYERLRGQLRSFGQVGAVMPLEVNVISGDGSAQGERGALMTASLFALARVPPIMGRLLLPADEVKGAPDVAVVGYRFWRRRLGGSPDVVGSTLRIAGVPTTIVGVMPEGFAMPSTEEIWLPLRVRSVDYPDGLGPAVWMYGRLADGMSLARARAELRTVRLQTVPDVRPNPVGADAVAFSAVQMRLPAEGPAIDAVLTIVQVVPVILLLIACGNAAILILARTATRMGEMAMRTVLGASRGRIVGQLFVETLLLALLATGIGLVVMDVAVARLVPRFTLPFWFDARVTPAFAVKALGVSILCSVVAGVWPALRATSRKLQPTIQSAGMGGGTLRLGRIAGTLIVIEIALGTAAVFGGGLIWRAFQPTPQAHTQVAAPQRYLVASIRIPRSQIGPSAAGEDEQLRVRLRTLQDALGRHLTSQPGVHGWTFSDRPPGAGAERVIRLDQSVTARPELEGAETVVDPSFFALLHVSPVAGRLFGAADVAPGAAAEPATAIVNMKFLERRRMQPQSAIGARIQLTLPQGGGFGPWKEIVGVVPNIQPNADRDVTDVAQLVYLPAAPGTLNPMTVTIDLGREGKEPTTFAPTLRRLVGEAEPAALLENIAALDQLRNDTTAAFRLWMSIMSGISVLAILLSTTALYAQMSMTVAQRKREFGIRLALGGSAAGVIVAVARRALVQIAAGVTLGVGFWLVIMLRVLTGGEIERDVSEWPYLMIAAATVVIAIGLAASMGPTLKYVRMRPVETLRGDR